jgi:hypothetical protein
MRVHMARPRLAVAPSVGVADGLLPWIGASSIGDTPDTRDSGRGVRGTARVGAEWVEGGDLHGE